MKVSHLLGVLTLSALMVPPAMAKGRGAPARARSGHVKSHSAKGGKRVGVKREPKVTPIEIAP